MQTKVLNENLKTVSLVRQVAKDLNLQSVTLTNELLATFN